MSFYIRSTNQKGNKTVNVHGLDYKMIDIYCKTFVNVDINESMSTGKILIAHLTFKSVTCVFQDSFLNSITVTEYFNNAENYFYDCKKCIKQNKISNNKTVETENYLN